MQFNSVTDVQNHDCKKGSAAMAISTKGSASHNTRAGNNDLLHLLEEGAPLLSVAKGAFKEEGTNKKREMSRIMPRLFCPRTTRLHYSFLGILFLACCAGAAGWGLQGGRCAKEGDTLTLIGQTDRSTNGGTYFRLSKPICVQSGKGSIRVDGVTVIGPKLSDEMQLRLTGKLRRHVADYEIEASTFSDVLAKEKTAYRTKNGYDALSTCIQWQTEESVSMHNMYYGGDTSPLFVPRCGLRGINNYTHTPVVEWLPLSGDGFASARAILGEALAGRSRPQEPFGDCSEWQRFVEDSLAKRSYPFEARFTLYYSRPRCGISFSNYASKERVYLWQPEELTIADVTVDNKAFHCVQKAARDGSPAYAFTPCVISADEQRPLIGTSMTYIRTVPSGAVLSVNGMRVTTTPADLVLQQPRSQWGSITIFLSKEGYKAGSVEVRGGASITVKLTRDDQQDQTQQ